MKRKIANIVIICLITSFAWGCSDSDGPYRQELDSLDKALNSHDSLIAEKEHRISGIKSLLKGTTDTGRYNLYDRLYTEYFSFDFDSAMHYAYLKRDAAADVCDSIKVAASSLQIARTSLSIGNEAEALSIIASVAPDTTDNNIKMMYHDVMASYWDMKHSGQQMLPHLLILRTLLDKSSTRWIFNECNILDITGKNLDAIDLMNKNDSILSADTRDLGIAHFLSARLKLQQGDTIGAISDLAISARNDIITPVRDYRSLYELANLLFQKDDIDRAYKYITFAVEDNNAAKVVDNIIATNNLMPAIVKAYELRNGQQNRIRSILLISLAIISSLLMGALIWAIRSRVTASKARRHAEDLNLRLKETNRTLSSLNRTLNESNQVKDAYLVQYLNSCSYYIDCLDRFRTGIKTAAKTRGIQAVEKQLETLSATDKELKVFYANFDRTFINLFPDFINGVNRLLNKEKQFESNTDGSMPTELRVLALIRLGICDSDQIASFLRRSVSTIYNIRVRLRNAAAIQRDIFEDEVKKLS